MCMYPPPNLNRSLNSLSSGFIEKGKEKEPPCVKYFYERNTFMCEREYKLKSIPGDGDCMYHCLSLILSQRDKVSYDSTYLRRICAIIILKLPYEQILLAPDYKQGMDWKQFAQKLAKSVAQRKWGDEYTLSLLAEKYNMAVWVVDVNNLPIQLFDPKSSPTYAIIQNIEQKHFQLIADKDDQLYWPKDTCFRALLCENYKTMNKRQSPLHFKKRSRTPNHDEQDYETFYKKVKAILKRQKTSKCEQILKAINLALNNVDLHSISDSDSDSDSTSGSELEEQPANQQLKILYDYIYPYHNFAIQLQGLIGVHVKKTKKNTCIEESNFWFIDGRHVIMPDIFKYLKDIKIITDDNWMNPQESWATAFMSNRLLSLYMLLRSHYADLHLPTQFSLFQSLKNKTTCIKLVEWTICLQNLNKTGVCRTKDERRMWHIRAISFFKLFKSITYLDDNLVRWDGLTSN